MCNFQLIRSNKCKKFRRSDFKSLLNRNVEFAQFGVVLMKWGRKFSEQADFRETVSNIATRSFFSYRSKHRVSQSVPSTRASLPINHTARSLSPSLPRSLPSSPTLPSSPLLPVSLLVSWEERTNRQSGKGFPCVT